MIRHLTPDDASAVLALRQECMLNAPLAFFASPEDDRFDSLEATRKHMVPSDQSMMVGAFKPELVGMAGIYREPRRKVRHKMTVWGMYVAPAFRGRGLARGLLEALIDYARQTEGVECVHLSVSSAAPEARRVYERAGFVVWGVEPDGLRDGGRSVDLVYMVLSL